MKKYPCYGEHRYGTNAICYRCGEKDPSSYLVKTYADSVRLMNEASLRGGTATAGENGTPQRALAAEKRAEDAEAALQRSMRGTPLDVCAAIEACRVERIEAQRDGLAAAYAEMRNGLERWAFIRNNGGPTEETGENEAPYSRCRACGRSSEDGVPIPHTKRCEVAVLLSQPLPPSSALLRAARELCDAYLDEREDQKVQAQWAMYAARRAEREEDKT